MVKDKFLLLTIASALLLGCEARKQPEPEAKPEQPPAVGFPAARTNAGGPEAQTYVCPRQITAYDPGNSSKSLGFFKAGSELRLTLMPAAPGMVVVTYQDPNGGKLITALCRADELGVGPPQQPANASPSPEPEKPKGLGGSRQPDHNAKYKPLGS